MSPKAAPLTNQVSIRPTYRRSINIERDTGTAALDAYVPPARALETLRRITRAMREPTSVRAWSVTGPYGAGKSSLALFIDALLGGDGDPTRLTAERCLAQADPLLLTELRIARSDFGAGPDGFVRAIVTAERESAARTVARALAVGVNRSWGANGGPRRLRADLRSLAASPTVPTARSLADLLTEVASVRPLVLVIDEFGKNLEHYNEDPATADLFTLQAIAERFSGDHGARGLLLTLQHLAFDQYASSAPVPQRREWTKIQGRFEDISYVHSPEHTVRLVTHTLDQAPANSGFRRARRTWAARTYATCVDRGLAPGLIADETQVEQCYPLHPVAVLVLAELCARYGQHERTLFNFLASSEPGSLASFIDEQPASVKAPPNFTVDRLYDYFVDAVTGSGGNAPGSGTRWHEIDTRIREFHGLSDHEVRCLKTIGLLNLVASGGALRASADLVSFALGAVGDEQRNAVAERLEELQQQGLITYRAFADEFRIWEGTDFDIHGAINAARSRLATAPPAALLNRVAAMPPVVAGRHSQRVGTLRYFRVMFADDATEIARLDNEEADGVLVLMTTALAPDTVMVVPPERPVVVATSPDAASLTQIALDLAAVHDALEIASGLPDDRVARREMQEQLNLAKNRLDCCLDRCFQANRTDVRWVLLNTGAEIAGCCTLSAILSSACDEIYSASPNLSNEMITRRELTSQGAKARRELIEAMFERGGRPQLGIDGFGPERAMYEAVLAHTGLHRSDKDGTAHFSPPHRGHSLHDAWNAIGALLVDARSRRVAADEIYKTLEAPPFGLKDGPIPVLLAAALLQHGADVAVYQDGTYQASVGADLMERLVKSPSRFWFRAFALDAGQLVLTPLAQALGIELRHTGSRRNAPLLSVVSPLMSLVRSLPPFAQHTTKLPPVALAVRAAITSAVEPDQLIFHTLPIACAQPLGPLEGVTRRKASEYARRLATALQDLNASYPDLLERTRTQLSSKMAVPTGSALRADVQVRASRLIDEILDGRLRSFAIALAEAGADDEDWLQAVATNVAGKPPQAWRDDDEARYTQHLTDLSGRFSRIEALHFTQHEHVHPAGFRAKQVTVVSTDAPEITGVVWVDDTLADALGGVVGQALERARKIIGPDGGRALLGLLAERVFEAGAEAVQRQNEPLRRLDHG